MNILFDGKICHLTYSHTDYKDIWPVYFSQMQKFFNTNIKHFLALESQTNSDIPNSVSPLYYNDAQPYATRLLKVLKQLTTYDYIFFDHEDMFLYEMPDFSELQKYYKVMQEEGLDVIRLIKGGDCRFEQHQTIPSLYFILRRSKWVFSIQPSLWRRTAIIELLESASDLNIWDFEVKSQKLVKKMRLNCAFSCRNGKSRGKHHYDNEVYPYIATAIVKSKWNISEYKEELTPLLEANQVDISFRGYV